VTVIVADVVNARVGDFIDDVPVIAGAFVDPTAADVPGEGSPAERAARMGRPAPRAAEPEKPRRRRRFWRTPLLIAIALAVVVGALAGTYALTQTYYFVGRDGSEVAIFRGVNTQFGPLKFFNVHKNTDVRLADLNPSVRSQVQDGITARNEKDAEQIVLNLHSQLLPLCVTSTSTPTSTPTPSSTPTPRPTTTRTTPRAGTSRSGTASASRARTSSRPASHTATPTPTPTPSQQPGVDCRPGP
jgi:PPM family protein phosphatase